jgi:hypothetical protein
MARKVAGCNVSEATGCSDSGLQRNLDKPALTLASLKFLQWQPLYEKEKPFQIFINIPDHVKDRRTTNLVFEDQLVKIEDVRSRLEEFTLDNNGFVFCHRPTTFSHFNDRKSVEEFYLPEVESLLRQEVDGADEVFFFDWRVSFRPKLSVKVGADSATASKKCSRGRGCHHRLE